MASADMPNHLQSEATAQGAVTSDSATTGSTMVRNGERQIAAGDLIDIAFNAPANVAAERRPVVPGSPVGFNGYTPQSVDERRRVAQRIISALPAGLDKAVQDQYDTLSQAAKRGIHAFAFGHDLADWARVHLEMDAPRRYMELRCRQDAYRRELDNALAAIGQLAAACPQSLRDTANLYLTDTSVSRKWGYDPPWKPDAVVDPATRTRFDALPKNAQDLIKAVNGHGVEQHRQFCDATREIRVLFGEHAQRIVCEHEPQGPYLPLRRHWEYVVEARSDACHAAEAFAAKTGDTSTLEELKRNSDHYTCIQARTIAEARALVQELEARFGRHNVDAMTTDAHYRNHHFPSWQRLDKWREKIFDYFDHGIDGARPYAKAMSRALGDMYLQSAADMSVRAAAFRGDMTGVVAKHALDTFFENGRRHNEFVANMLHAAEIAQAIRGMVAEVRLARTAGARAARTAIVNEFLKRATAQMKPSPQRIMDGPLMFNAAWRLLTSPAHYLQYIAQPAALAMPVIGGRHGYTAGWREMIAAAWDTMSLIKAAKGMDVMCPDASRHVSRVGDERGMLADLQRKGMLDAENDNHNDYNNPRALSDNDLTRYGAQAMSNVTAVARGLETHNRIVSALAAYRLAYADAMNRGVDATGAHAAGVTFAHDVIHEAYAARAASHAPAMLGAALASDRPAHLLAPLRNFNIVHTAIVARMLRGMFSGAAKEEKIVAAKSLAYMAAHYEVLAGAMGMPGARLLGYAIQRVFAELDVPADQEAVFRRAIGDADLANIILHGTPAAVGTLRRHRMSAGDSRSPIAALNMDCDRSGTDDDGAYTLAAMGPCIGITVPNVIEGAGKILQGDYYGGLEKVVPSGIRDAMNAYSRATGGLHACGDMRTDAEDIFAMDQALQAAAATCR